MSSSPLRIRAMPIRLLALDVDGVLTDGRLYFSPDGAEIKVFDCQDGLGIKLLQQAGIQCAIITGRTSALVDQRAQDLQIPWVIKGRDDKLIALQELAQKLNLTAAQIAYVGDDLPDLSAIQWSGLGIAVANAHPLIQQKALWCTKNSGGRGAVREICEGLLQWQGKLAAIFDSYSLLPSL